MRLSIIVPVYAAEKYLRENMMTIIPQLTSECELILIDDGSKDHSGKVCDELSEVSPHVKVIHKENGGVSSARNVGLKVACGQYITFVDSDDRVSDDYVHSVLELLEADCDIGFFGADTFGGASTESIKPWLSEVKKTPDIFTAYGLIFGNKSNEPWDKVFRSELINANNLTFAEGIHLGEDIMFTLDYILCCRTVAITDKVIYSYYMNQQGLSRKQKSLSTLQYYDAVFTKLLTTARKTGTGEKYLQLTRESILQILVNYCGKLLRSGVNRKAIYESVSCYDWYNEVVSADYSGAKNNIRVFLLRGKQYKLISMIFNK